MKKRPSRGRFIHTEGCSPVFVFPEFADPLGDLHLLCIAFVRLIEFGAGERFGQKLQIGEAACAVVGVFVAFAVTLAFPEFGQIV